MASNVPIFVYGPDDVPPTVEAQKFDYAFVHTSQDLVALEGSLRHALTDEPERNRLTHNALKHVRDNHEFSHVVDTFRLK
ncbi:MAG: glycosyltransferase, partial [Rhodospirillales bacterium]